MPPDIHKVKVVFNKIITSVGLPDTYMFRPTSETVTGAAFSLYADTYFQNHVLLLPNYFDLV